MLSNELIQALHLLTPVLVSFGYCNASFLVHLSKPLGDSAQTSLGPSPHSPGGGSAHQSKMRPGSFSCLDQVAGSRVCCDKLRAPHTHCRQAVGVACPCRQAGGQCLKTRRSKSDRSVCSEGYNKTECRLNALCPEMD